MRDGLLRDIRFAIRQARRAPAFSTAAILTLAIGIGSNTAIFSILDALAMRSLPVKAPAELLAITARNPKGQIRVTPIPAVEILSKDGPLSEICAYNGGVIVGIEARGQPYQLTTALLTGGCFRTLGVSAQLGRTLNEGDTSLYGPGKRVAVVSDRFWSRAFGRDPATIGETIRADGVDLEIVGILPPRFFGLHVDTGVDLFAPFDSILPARKDRRPGASHILGRLQPGIPLNEANAQLSARWPSIVSEVAPPSMSVSERADLMDVRPSLEPIGRGISGYRETYLRPTGLIMGLTAILFGLVCLNLGGLLISRLSVREGELSVRFALGGTRQCVSRQLIVENLLLSLSAGVLSVPVAILMVRALAQFLPTGLGDRSISFEPDVTAWSFAAAASIFSGLLMSVIPVFIATRTEVVLAASNRTIVASANRWSEMFLTTQIALSVVMLVGAGLMARSVYLLQYADLGIRTESVTVFRLMPLPGAYRDLNNAQYYPELLNRVLGVPGVEAASLSRMFPRMVVESPGQAVNVLGEQPGDVRAVIESISPGYFETLRIPFMDGAGASWEHNDQSRQVAILSAGLANSLSPSASMVGRRVRAGGETANQDLLVIGVVGDATMGSPRHSRPNVIYRPALQAGRLANYPNLLIETSRAPEDISRDVRTVLRSLGREYVQDFQPLRSVFVEAPSSERMSASIAVALGLLAALLTFIGIHSHCAQRIAHRWREFGLKIALGAEPNQLFRQVAWQSIVLSLSGFLFGVLITIALAPSLQWLLFSVQVRDTLTWAGILVLLLLLTGLATLLPAKRLFLVDPSDLLRRE